MKLETHIVSCAGIILNDKEEILLVKNPKRGWEFPGGRIENGETLYEGLTREIKEESGVKVEICHLANINSIITGKPGYGEIKWIPTQVVFDFITYYKSGDTKISDESLETKWFKKEDAIKAITNELFKDRLIAMLEYNGKIRYRVMNLEPYKLISEQDGM